MEISETASMASMASMASTAPDPAELGRRLGGLSLGVATAAAQIEGSADIDGKGRSIWDDFAAVPGQVRGGGTPATGTDSYRRWREDLDTLVDLGVDAYRFSVSWPRVVPDGVGRVNQAGLDHYDAFVDALLERGIDPVLTLFHWDLPSPLESRGGWLSRDTVNAFAEYAGVVAGRLGDRVRVWTTHNEPFCFALLGYAVGRHAPGKVLGRAAFPAVHHALLSHGMALQAVRSAVAHPTCSITLNLAPVVPVSESAPDAAASLVYDGWQNRVWTDPVLTGRYPQDVAELFDSPHEVIRDGDLEVIGGGVDVLGVNYYNPMRVAASADPASALGLDLVPFEGVPTTAFGWPVMPEYLTRLLTGLREEYGTLLPPIMVTENGCSVDDAVVQGSQGPAVHDEFRIRFLAGHLDALTAARDAGVDVRGYFAWTLVDNFEWAEGYTQRFGLVHNDQATQRRTRKDSFAWYAALCAAKGRVPIRIP